MVIFHRYFHRYVSLPEAIGFTTVYNIPKNMSEAMPCKAAIERLEPLGLFLIA
jgi:hypothetical protein